MMKRHNIIYYHAAAWVSDQIAFSDYYVHGGYPDRKDGLNFS